LAANKTPPNFPKKRLHSAVRESLTRTPSTRPENASNAWLFSFPFWIIVDTEAAPQTMEVSIGDCFVRAYPPFRSAPANFPYAPPIDKQAVPFDQGLKVRVEPGDKMLTLASTPTLGPTPGTLLMWGEDWGERPRNFPMDSFRIDVISAQPGTAKAHQELVEDLMFRLLRLLRWKSGQWWILRSVQPLMGFVRNDFPIDRNGVFLPNDIPSPHSRAHPGYGFERPITQEMWQAVLGFWRSSSSPPEADLILLDAYYFVATAEIRRAVVDAATACEVAKDEFFERRWREQSSEPFRRGRMLRGYDLPDHIDVQMQRWIRRSYRVDHPQHFVSIQNLWDARGNVAHGGPLTYRTNKTQTEVTRDEAIRLCDAVRHCVGWLQGL
jgi:hypothetical protein